MGAADVTIYNGIMEFVHSHDFKIVNLHMIPCIDWELYEYMYKLKMIILKITSSVLEHCEKLQEKKSNFDQLFIIYLLILFYKHEIIFNQFWKIVCSI